MREFIACAVWFRVGPDLSDIGALRRTAEIEQSILDPSRSAGAEPLLPGGYETGGNHHRPLLNLDSFNVLCSIPKSVCFRSAPTCAKRILKDSPMPSYRGKLSPRTADVVAYLNSLKGL